jgi:hypothetical protein
MSPQKMCRKATEGVELAPRAEGRLDARQRQVEVRGQPQQAQQHQIEETPGVESELPVRGEERQAEARSVRER